MKGPTTGSAKGAYIIFVSARRRGYLHDTYTWGVMYQKSGTPEKPAAIKPEAQEV